MELETYKYIIIASHRRSGTHFLIDSLFNNFDRIKNGYINLDRLQYSHRDNLSIQEFEKIVNSDKKILLKTHSFGDFATFFDEKINDFIDNKIIPFSKTIYILREGKDVLNSLFYYLKSQGVNFKDFSEFLTSKNHFDNIRSDLKRIEFYKEHKNSWNNKKNIYKVNYEDLKNMFDDELKKIAVYLELELKLKISDIGIKKYNIIQRALRRVFPNIFRSTAILPRKGKIGDWRSNFSNKDLKYYNEIITENKSIIK